MRVKGAVFSHLYLTIQIIMKNKQINRNSKQNQQQPADTLKFQGKIIPSNWRLEGIESKNTKHPMATSLSPASDWRQNFRG